MIREILPNLYTIEVPLTGNPLKAINSYVIKAGERSLIIDTGMNREECMNAITSGLKELDIDLAKTDFFISHLHADHSGLVSTLATKTSTVYFGEADAYVVTQRGQDYWEQIPHIAKRHGFPEDEIIKALKSHPGVKYSSKGSINVHVVKDGDTIRIGDYTFKCIETPGHTKGHICLYESDKKLFVSGDHILVNITPNISLWSVDDNENPLRSYLSSLDKVRDLDVELVLPGHRSRFENYRERIDELKKHHERRIKEVISILKQASRNTYQVASRMTWDLSYKSWDEFPAPQKWFASGEALAHLRYLEEKGEIQSEPRDQEIMFSLKDDAVLPPV